MYGLSAKSGRTSRAHWVAQQFSRLMSALQVQVKDHVAETYLFGLPSRKLTWKPKKGPKKTAAPLKGAIWVSMLVLGSVLLFEADCAEPETLKK